ncbi:hypothetical protein ACG33_00885 [Steroidobacter denitrificans]|uniref:Glycosyltransferase subfamily 4-like N-terminal domain-containing protein n=1 Tax=Steroidobacter denitrificans TaxID=465721 RepID=A0A127F5I3_STEDE|nr:glycosyltransferase [Steroidobacter denitrificans]AMN45683.1 hypothetical protein ACG33_00885 [Steroidobacter denitrificans]
MPNLRQLRILHIVDATGASGDLQQQLFMPLLTRMPQDRIKTQVASLSPDAVPAAVLRQYRIPVHDVHLSRRRFSWRAIHDLSEAARLFRPHVIQAWGHTAQLLSMLLGKRCDWQPRIIWSAADSSPLARDAGVLDRWKLKGIMRLSTRVDRIVYASEADAVRHRRAGFPEGKHLTVPPGVDAIRFKPDPAARSRLRTQLQIDSEAFVIGMSAAFRPQSDHATLLKAVADLIKSHPRIVVLLAGHGVQKGNAALAALLGNSSLATRTHLLGEWSDLAALYNACDVVCSSALHDGSRMQLVMAMLCGVPCIGTGLGAQGEVIGRFGIAVEPGSPPAFVKGVTRLLELTPEKRLHLVRNARRHALQNYIHVRLLQRYLQLYYDLAGCNVRGKDDIPAFQCDMTIGIDAAADPGTSRPQTEDEILPTWQQQASSGKKQAPSRTAPPGAERSQDDVLRLFEAELAREAKANRLTGSPQHERARGVVEEGEDLLAPEALQMPPSAVTGMMRRDICDS